MASAEQPGNPSPEDPTASAPPEAGAEAASTSPERQFMQDITGVGQPNMTNSQREYLRSLRGMQDIPLVKQRIRTRKDRSSTARPTPRLGGASTSARRGPGLSTRLRRTMRRWFRPSGDAPGSSRGIVGGLLAVLSGQWPGFQAVQLLYPLVSGGVAGGVGALLGRLMRTPAPVR